MRNIMIIFAMDGYCHILAKVSKCVIKNVLMLIEQLCLVVGIKIYNSIQNGCTITCQNACPIIERVFKLKYQSLSPQRGIIKIII
jgi:hypothetical protein